MNPDSLCSLGYMPEVFIKQFLFNSFAIFGVIFHYGVLLVVCPTQLNPRPLGDPVAY